MVNGIGYNDLNKELRSTACSNYVGKEVPDVTGEIDWIEVKPTDYLG
jgi:hypothetical protein